MKGEYLQEKLNYEKFEIYFHLGLPKTASTFIQYEIFPNLTDIKFYHKHKFKLYKELDKNELSGKYLFSSEKDKKFEEVVDRISKVFPFAKIILVFRRHDDWILSKYKYYIRKHGPKSFKEFFDLESNNGKWKREELLYQKKIEYVEKHFYSTPLILTFDKLKENPEEFISEITNYMNSSLQSNTKKQKIVKKAFKKKQLIVIRKFNRLFKYKKARTKSKLLNLIHYKYWEFALHIVAFFSLFLPKIMTKNIPLIENEEILEKIRKYYEYDWQYCLKYNIEQKFEI